MVSDTFKDVQRFNAYFTLIFENCEGVLPAIRAFQAFQVVPADLCRPVDLEDLRVPVFLGFQVFLMDQGLPEVL